MCGPASGAGGVCARPRRRGLCFRPPGAGSASAAGPRVAPPGQTQAGTARGGGCPQALEPPNSRAACAAQQVGLPAPVRCELVESRARSTRSSPNEEAESPGVECSHSVVCGSRSIGGKCASAAAGKAARREPEWGTRASLQCPQPAIARLLRRNPPPHPSDRAPAFTPSRDCWGCQGPQKLIESACGSVYSASGCRGQASTSRAAAAALAAQRNAAPQQHTSSSQTGCCAASHVSPVSSGWRAGSGGMGRGRGCYCGQRRLRRHKIGYLQHPHSRPRRRLPRTRLKEAAAKMRAVLGTTLPDAWVLVTSVLVLAIASLAWRLARGCALFESVRR
jgi:hypothetical protein